MDEQDFPQVDVSDAGLVWCRCRGGTEDTRLPSLDYKYEHKNLLSRKLDSIFKIPKTDLSSQSQQIFRNITSDKYCR